MGDSISDGAGAPSGRSYVDLLVENVDSAWPDHAEVDLASSFPSITEIIDVAEGGATTNTLISRQLPQLDGEVGGFPASGETIVVFTIGGNDAQNALNPLVDADALLASVLGNFEDIVSWLQNEERFPDGVRIYATNVYEPTNSTGQYSTCFLGFDISSRLPTLTAFNDDLADLGADMGFSVVDLRGHFDAHGFHSGDSSLATYDGEDPTLWYAADCIHPNERGHHEVRRLFHAAIMGHPLALE
jgi:lysophospholipase L1-like esterase